jgi:hypothetical protein
MHARYKMHGTRLVTNLFWQILVAGSSSIWPAKEYLWSAKSVRSWSIFADQVLHFFLYHSSPWRCICLHVIKWIYGKIKSLKKGKRVNKRKNLMHPIQKKWLIWSHPHWYGWLESCHLSSLSCHFPVSYKIRNIINDSTYPLFKQLEIIDILKALLPRSTRLRSKKLGLARCQQYFD